MTELKVIKIEGLPFKAMMQQVHTRLLRNAHLTYEFALLLVKE
jgi:hypothetical protein